MTKIFFATDVHGSELCFQKFLRAADFYNADLLFFGGDYSSKDVLLFSQDATTVLEYRGTVIKKKFERQSEVLEYISLSRGSGVSVEEVDQNTINDPDNTKINQAYERALRKKLESWVEMAKVSYGKYGIPIFVIPGNDDLQFTDEYFQQPPFQFVHRKHVLLDCGVNVLGWGGSNRTPWNTAREYDETDILQQLNEAVRYPLAGTASILFAHPPPYNSGLDLAPEVGENFQLKLTLGSPHKAPIGSRAVRQFVEAHQPMVGLFGHVHEGRGYHKIGNTTCINPGSMYYTGRLVGCLVTIEEGRVKNFQFTEG
jgi:Icc-related predicted phosphoesterase